MKKSCVPFAKHTTGATCRFTFLPPDRLVALAERFRAERFRSRSGADAKPGAHL